MANDRFKCRFCPWQTPRWTTSMQGKRRHGVGRLQVHVEQAHHAEYDAILARVFAEEDSAPDTLEEHDERGRHGHTLRND